MTVRSNSQDNDSGENASGRSKKSTSKLSAVELVTSAGRIEITTASSF